MARRGRSDKKEGKFRRVPEKKCETEQDRQCDHDHRSNDAAGCHGGEKIHRECATA